MFREILKLRRAAPAITNERFLSLVLRRFETNRRPITFAELKNSLFRAIGTSEEFDPKTFSAERKRLIAVLPEKQDDLPRRTQRDSYEEVILPLESDHHLRESFINVFMGIRTGRLLECLDLLAGHCCFKYALNPKQNIPSPFSIVTALVDELSFRSGDLIDSKKDILMTGFVSWVGRSSMEVTMSVLQEEREKVRTVFVMVARDPLNRGAAVINPMELQNELDKAYFENGAKNMERRKRDSARALTRTAPNAEESLLIHDMFLAWEKNPTLCATGKKEKLMSESTYSNISICHPAHRNRYNKIFGGYVMRMAYELAWASATSFSCGTRVIVAFIDEIWFRTPVEVGSILHYNAVIGYTEKDSIVVRVVAEVEDYKTGMKELTNTFYFTFKTCDGSEVPNVIPRSYKEYVIYLDSRRHSRQG